MLRKALFAVTILILNGAAPLMAQINEAGVTEDNIEMLPMERPLAEYALLGLFLVAALGLGFFSSRRTND